MSPLNRFPLFTYRIVGVEVVQVKGILVLTVPLIKSLVLALNLSRKIQYIYNEILL